MVRRKITHEQVVQEFAEQGFTLLSRYIKNVAVMDARCNNGHEIQLSRSALLRGSGCRVCNGKVITQSEAVRKFADRGFTLTGIYTAPETPIDCICSNGHAVKMSWRSVVSEGIQCRVCTGALVTQEQVVKEFADRGFTLLDTYINAERQMRCICSQGHDLTISRKTVVTRGGSCRYCAGLRIKHEQVEQEFKSFGFTLLDQYKPNGKKLKAKCPQGHISSITRSNFLKDSNKSKCSYCAGNARLTQQEAVERFASRGFQLHGVYTNIDTRAEVECPKGHQIQVSLYQCMSGAFGCYKCAKNKKFTQQEVESALALKGFKLLSDYIGADRHILVECPKGHVAQSRFRTITEGAYGCYQCSGKGLSEERREERRISERIRGQIKQSLKRQQAKKPFSSHIFSSMVAKQVLDILGPTPEKHHLDHIIPRSWFDCRDAKQVTACWSIVNLRWLQDSVNIGRNNRLTHEEVKMFSEEQLAILRVASFKPEEFSHY